MRHAKALILCAALLVFAAVTAFALPVSPWTELWNSGCDLLFRTDNVTVDGEAVFSLDGQAFKRAKLHYVQDGYASFYGLQLFTPRADGSERETGWKIIADEEGDVYVMEAFFPGVYRTGSDNKQNTLLRRSVQLDALTALGGAVAGSLEGLLPAGTLTAEDRDGGKQVHIALAQGQIPELLSSAFNLGAGYLIDRWSGCGHDRSQSEEDGVSFENYLTVFQALAWGTARWTLQDARVDCAIDAQGRLTDVQGTARVASTFMDGSIREVGVTFSLAMTGYGESSVNPFHPADYQVKLAEGYYSPVEAREQARQADRIDDLLLEGESILLAQGYPISSEAVRKGSRESGLLFVSIQNPDGTEYACAFDQDGGLTILQNLTGDWMELEAEEGNSADAETVEKAQAFVREFVTDVNPAFGKALGGLVPLYTLETKEGKYLVLDMPDNEGATAIVRIEPSLRVEYFSATGNG